MLVFKTLSNGQLGSQRCFNQPVSASSEYCVGQCIMDIKIEEP